MVKSVCALCPPEISYRPACLQFGSLPDPQCLPQPTYLTTNQISVTAIGCIALHVTVTKLSDITFGLRCDSKCACMTGFSIGVPSCERGLASALTSASHSTSLLPTSPRSSGDDHPSHIAEYPMHRLSALLTKCRQAPRASDKLAFQESIMPGPWTDVCETHGRSSWPHNVLASSIDDGRVHSSRCASSSLYIRLTRVCLASHPLRYILRRMDRC